MHALDARRAGKHRYRIKDLCLVNAGGGGAPHDGCLAAWLREQRSRLSNASWVAKPIDYILRRWDRFAHFIDDGRICLTNNAAVFAGSERGAAPPSWPRGPGARMDRVRNGSDR